MMGYSDEVPPSFPGRKDLPGGYWILFGRGLCSQLGAVLGMLGDYCQCYMDIRTKLENNFMKSLQAEGVDGHGSEVDGIKSLPWYPENLVWKSTYSRNQLSKNQILERYLRCSWMYVRIILFSIVLEIYVDVQRRNLLIHQTKKMSTANLIVTNHEAQHFPSCHDRNHANGSETRKVRELDINQLQYDRVLCDVPCSGDGTLRNAPDIWRKWNAGMGNGLHGLQIHIAI